MLILPESLYEARDRLARDFEEDKIGPEQCFLKMLELDPDDHLGMLGLGRLRRDAGDAAGAKEFFWRAARAQPYAAAPYVELAKTFSREPDSEALVEALGELAIDYFPVDEFQLKDSDFEKVSLNGKLLEDFKKLPPPEQMTVVSRAMQAARKTEPESVAKLLYRFRLLQQLRDDDELDAATVDTIVREGESIVPLLVGALRGWAHNIVGDDFDIVVERALALVGETGSSADIAHLLEFVDLDHEGAAGASAWAVGRVFERHPEETGKFILAAAPGLGPAERLVLAQHIIRHPHSDPTSALLPALANNLEQMKGKDRDSFLFAFLAALAAGKGRKGVEIGREALFRQGALLSKIGRRDCEDLLKEFADRGYPSGPITPPITLYEICAGSVIWDGDEDDDEFEVEEEEFPPLVEPIRRKVVPGRNDACWCGSGNKYKKCHLDSDSAPAISSQQRSSSGTGPKDEFVRLRKRIGQFLADVLKRPDFDLAMREYLGEESPGPADTDVAVTDWLLHDYISQPLGHPVMKEFLVRQGPRLTEREREMVKAWSLSFMNLYEVQDLTAGVGVKVKDLILGETFFVHDVNLSTRLARWDGLLARMVPGERGTEFAGAGLTVPRHSIQALRDWMEEDRASTKLAWPDYLKQNWPRIRRRSFEISQNWVESLRLANTDGDDLLFSKAIYEMAERTAVFEALKACPEFHTGDDEQTEEHLVWLNSEQTVLGNIRSRTGQLVLECNSKQRLKRGKLLLSSFAGKSLKHLRDEFTTTEELRRQAAEDPADKPEPPSEIPKEIRDEMIGNFLEKHYSGWPDTKLPALEGKTPRQAVRSAKGRRLVIAVLRDIENTEDRKRQRGEPFYDVSRIREKLALN